MVYCERCEEEVKELTKSTGTCPTCAKEEVEQADLCAKTSSDLRANRIVEVSLEEEGYDLDEIPDRKRGKRF